MVACEGRPTGMTLGLYLRVSPSSLDMFFQSERLTLLYIYFIWTAPLFALAFEGALLPLSMHEPALSPLLALPKRIEPRTECLRDPPTLSKRAVQSYYIFMVSASQRANLTIYIFKRGASPGGEATAVGGGVLCALRAPYAVASTVSFVVNASVNSQRTAPPPAVAPEGAPLPSSMHEPARSPALAWPKRREPRTAPASCTLGL